MLKELFEAIQAKALPTTFEIEGRTYSSKELELIQAPTYSPKTIEVGSLSSLCDLIAREISNFKSSLFVRVKSYSKVEVFTSFEDKATFERYNLYIAYSDTPQPQKHWLGLEEAIIQLRSLYIPTDDSVEVLNTISNLNKSASVEFTDNGTTQTVQTVQGIATKGQTTIKPIVNLRPFRTFLEVEQPESKFLFRVSKDGEVKFFEADGGAWEIEAKCNIKEFIEEQLKELIEQGRVIVMK